MRKFFSFLLFLLSLVQIRCLSTYNFTLAKFAFEFAAAAYAENPTPCLSKNNATFIFRIKLPCDYVKDECWSTVALTDDYIVVSFRGTKTKLQLITELVETMSEPKRKLHAGGSVQHYFYIALSAVWQPVRRHIEKLAKTYPNRQIIFTGHSLGGALASLASTVLADRKPELRTRIRLVTFGQPRVGNFEYAQVHDKLVPFSWRIIHKYDLVAHLPLCAIRLISHSCFPFFNHAPYHHGTEIWYPETMNSTSLFKICNGLPVNEDDACSNGWYIHYGIQDHIIYFEHDVSAYGSRGCIEDKSS